MLRYVFLKILFVFFVSSAIAQTNSQQQEVERHISLAEKAAKKNDWITAEYEWKKVLELSPNNATVWNNLGISLDKQNRRNEAIEAWMKATKLNPKLSSAFFYIGITYTLTNNFALAIAPLKQTLYLDSDNQEARKALAISLIGVDKYQEATREIAQLLAKNPKDAALLEMAAQCFWQQKRFAETVMVLKRRLDLGNEKAELWALYGDALDAMKQTSEAAIAYEKAVALNPASNDLRYALGAFYWKLIRYDDAEKVLLEVLKRNPNEARAAFNLGDIYLTKGDAQKALPYLEQAAKGFPNEFDTRFALGRALLMLNQNERAVEELQAAVKINDKIAEGYFHLGRALQKLGRKDEAKAALDKAKEIQEAKRASEKIKPQ